MKKQILSIISLILVLTITICGCSNSHNSTASEEESPVSFTQRPALADTNEGTINLTKNIQSDSANGKAIDNTFINSQADFAVNLFKQTIKMDKNKNALISPLSIQLVLAMAFNGADGETKKEFEKLMGEITVEELNKYLYNYIKTLDNDQLNITNSIWIRNGFKIQNDFLKANKSYYSSDVYGADFNAKTIEDINNWASDKTDNMIKELLSDDSLDKDKYSVMCLVNALLLDANWAKEYLGSDDTQEFTNITGEKKTVQTLITTLKSFFDDGDATGFKKELEGGKFSFVAMLPNEDIHINDYINSLTGKKLLNTLNNPQEIYTHTKMPEFCYEYNGSKIKESLHNLGIRLAFDPKNADFSKIAPEVSIDKFIHKTKISVNEVGVKAASASAAIAIHNGIIPCEAQVIIDRPFVYMIIDNKTNLPIFIGTVMDV